MSICLIDSIFKAAWQGWHYTCSCCASWRGIPSGALSSGHVNCLFAYRIARGAMLSNSENKQLITTRGPLGNVYAKWEISLGLTIMLTVIKGKETHLLDDGSEDEEKLHCHFPHIPQLYSAVTHITFAGGWMAGMDTSSLSWVYCATLQWRKVVAQLTWRNYCPWSLLKTMVMKMKSNLS